MYSGQWKQGMEVKKQHWAWEHSSSLGLMGRYKVWVGDRPQIPLPKVEDCGLAMNRRALTV